MPESPTAVPGAASSPPPARNAPERRTLRGTLERITFHNEENGYTIARLMPQGRDYVVTIVGHMMNVTIGASLRLRGQWVTHAQYGKQFVVEEYTEELPATVEGLRKYLGSGLIKGIGPVTADRIVGHFGLETLAVIEQAPERLIEVPGVGRKRVGLIGRAWQEQQQIKEIMLFLQAHDVSTGLAVKIFKRYGGEAVAVVREDPYRLAREVYGIGFLTADRIAQRLGIASDNPRRIEAGLVYALGQQSDNGHVFAPRDLLVAEGAGLLAVEPGAIEEAIERLAQTRELWVEEVVEEGGTVEAVYLAPFYFAEVGIANRLRRLVETPATRLGPLQTIDWATAFEWLDRHLPYPLAERQRLAVRTALTSKVCVLTGGPGTGKTTTVRAVLQLLGARKLSVVLAAPTGRAAKRLAETTGMEAKTIHRLLEFKPGPGTLFARDEDHPLNADLVVIDEVSMVDTLLMNHLTKAIDPTSHLLLVGDKDQLPSVGPGNVLHDLIASGAVPVVALDQIFRQTASSYIVVNAHRINHGQMPFFERDSGDFFLFKAEDSQSAADWIVDVVTRRIPARFGLDPLRDVQVLSPMHRGAAGVALLNQTLQAALNPPAAHKPEASFAGRTFRLGDKVMQIRNNYDKDVFNGDLGQVAAIDAEDQVVTVSFEGTAVAYEYSELDELVHAFACSFHKSQGAEYPAVVLALLPAHYLMLQRNLLYTGVTRARRLCVIVGSTRAIAMAVKNDQVAQRHTGLARRLAEAGGGGR
jgi:exodeoxyribonuclease V alpha subunit